MVPVFTLTLPLLQIAQAIADRKEAEEVNSRLSRMRGDEGKFRDKMQQRRMDSLKVSINMDWDLW